MKKLKPRGRPSVRLEGNRQPETRPTTAPPTRTGGGGPSGPRPPQRSAPQQPSMVLMGLIYGGIGLLVLGVAAVTFLIIAPPTDLIRNQIVSEVRAETGREFKIDGPASFTFFPSFGIRARDVSLSAPPEMGGEPVMSAKTLDVGVRLWPLIRQDIVIDRLVLTKPIFNLRVDAQGRRSWDMAAARPAPVRFAEARTTVTDAPIVLAAAEGRRSRDIAKGELSLGLVRVTDGMLRYSDERSHTLQEVTAIDADVEAPALASPVTAKGSFLSQSEKIAFDAKITALGDIVNERPAQLALNVAGRPLSVRFDGRVSLKDDMAAEGSLSGDTTSFRTLAEWLGTRLPRSGGFGPGSLSGNLKAGSEAWRFSDAKLTLDGATATGTVGVITSGPRPHIVADLKVANLNLDTYEEHGGGEPPAAPSEETTPQPAPRAPGSIDDLLEQPGPKVKGYTHRAGWSAEPFDLAALDIVDADAKLSLTGLTYGGMHVDNSEVVLALKDRVMKTTLADLSLYQGRGNGVVTIDGTGKEALLSADFALAGIAAEPLLKDSAGIDWISGRYKGNMSIKGHGASEEALVQSLKGTADFAVSNGAVSGFDLDGALRELRNGNLPDFETSPSRKTNFSALTGSFVITDGIAQNEDLKLVSSSLHATGSGSIDLPARSLDYTLRPTLIAGEGDTGSELEVPVHITGALDAPKIEPDVQGALNSQKNQDAVKDLAKKLNGKNVGEAINNLFGKGENGEPSKAEKFFNKLFGDK